MSEYNLNKVWDKEVVRAYSKVIKSIQNVASALISLGFVGYILGWIRARSYFSEFGAEWIFNELSLMYLIKLSVVPILAILIFLITSLSDIARRIIIGKELVKTLVFLIVVFLMIHSFGIYLNYIQNYSSYLNISFTKVFYSALILTLVFGKNIIALMKTGHRWSSENIWELLLWSALFLFSIYSLGKAEGKVDSDLETSTLPTVILDSEQSEISWRLLYSQGDNLYIVKPANKDSEIQIVKPEDISHIRL